MNKKEVTNEDLMYEIKSLRSEIECIRRMIYETNADFFDVAQIANDDNDGPEILPLSNRELILYALQRYPVIDPETGRERLATKEEILSKRPRTSKDFFEHFEARNVMFMEEK